jgi:hypothetical protein
MVGANQLVAHVQQLCAWGTILRCTVVLVEGATSEAGEEVGPPGPRGTE